MWVWPLTLNMKRLFMACRPLGADQQIGSVAELPASTALADASRRKA